VGPLVGHSGPVVLDIDASLVQVHSENKAGTAASYKGGFGFHPMFCFADATGEALASVLRPSNAAANSVVDVLSVLNDVGGAARPGDPSRTTVPRSSPTRHATLTADPLVAGGDSIRLPRAPHGRSPAGYPSSRRWPNCSPRRPALTDRADRDRSRVSPAGKATRGLNVPMRRDRSGTLWCPVNVREARRRAANRWLTAKGESLVFARIFCALVASLIVAGLAAAPAGAARHPDPNDSALDLRGLWTPGSSGQLALPGLWCEAPADGGEPWMVRVEITSDSSRGVATANFWYGGRLDLLLGTGKVRVLNAEHEVPFVPDGEGVPWSPDGVTQTWGATRPGLPQADRYNCPAQNFGSPALDYLVGATITYIGRPPVRPTVDEIREHCETGFWWEIPWECYELGYRL
jgi:hypothetical protein